MAILSFAGTGISLLAIFFRDAQKFDAYLHPVKALARAYQKPSGSMASLSYRSYRATLEAHGKFCRVAQP
jgi:hypothetical protein